MLKEREDFYLYDVNTILLVALYFAQILLERKDMLYVSGSQLDLRPEPLRQQKIILAFLAQMKLY